MRVSNNSNVRIILLIAGALLTADTALADSRSHELRFSFKETSIAFHQIDVPATKADGAAGDIITFESNLSDKGKDIGSLQGYCVQIRADATLDDCEVTVTIGTNSYRMSGLFDPAKGGTLAVVGGTGKWVGASGTNTIVNQPDGTAIHTVLLRL